VEFRQGKLREATLAKSAGARITLDQLHEQLKAGDVKELPLVIKADVQGSVEVLSEMLPKLSDDRVKLKIIHASIGASRRMTFFSRRLRAQSSWRSTFAPTARPPTWLSAKASKFGRTRSFTKFPTKSKSHDRAAGSVFKETHLAAPKSATHSASKASA